MKEEYLSYGLSGVADKTGGIMRRVWRWPDDGYTPKR